MALLDTYLQHVYQLDVKNLCIYVHLSAGQLPAEHHVCLPFAEDVEVRGHGDVH